VMFEDVFSVEVLSFLSMSSRVWHALSSRSSLAPSITNFASADILFLGIAEIPISMIFRESGESAALNTSAFDCSSSICVFHLGHAEFEYVICIVLTMLAMVIRRLSASGTYPTFFMSPFCPLRRI